MSHFLACSTHLKPCSRGRPSRAGRDRRGRGAVGHGCDHVLRPWRAVGDRREPAGRARPPRRQPDRWHQRVGGGRAPGRAVSIAAPARPRLGLGANWRQFTLLVVVNAFVGAMVGIERTVLPLLAEEDFGIASTSAALSFLVAFGLVKAATNLFAGHLSDRYGRKRRLVAGWVAALPVAPLVIWAPSWGWVVLANAFLGLNQGLAW